jgi:cold shock CspA family protein
MTEIRLADLDEHAGPRGLRMTGVVIRFDPVLCHGLILGEDSVDYYVHTSDVAGPRLVLGCRVAFAASWARRRPRAVAVRRLEPAELDRALSRTLTPTEESR